MTTITTDMRETEQAEVETPIEFWLHSYYVGMLDDRLAKLNRKAAKLGCPPVGYTILRTEERLAENQIDIEHIHVIQMTGEAPRFSGWQFLATLQHEPSESGYQTIVRKVPFAEEGIDVRAYRTAAPYCDHCRTERNRKDTYLVKHDDGTLRQVGRSCLKDFLGHSSPEAIAGYLEMLAAGFHQFRDADEDSLGCGGDRYEYTRLDAFLAYTAEAVAQFGWVSRSAARMAGDYVLTTVMRVEGNFADLRSRYEHVRERAWHPTDANRKVAEDALAWLRNGWGKQDPNTLSDYQHSLLVACGGEALHFRNHGLAASLIGTYLREMGELALRKARESKPVVKLEAAKGDRLRSIKAELLTVRTMVDKFSGEVTSHQHKFLTEQGHSLVWYASNAEWEPGQYTIDFTIKDFSEYKGEPQVIVSRVSVSKPKAARSKAKAAT